jgi:hypothetical protein
LYAIISFLILFQQYASDYEFFQQFLNNDGVPFRMQASVFLQQLRIAVTARSRVPGAGISSNVFDGSTGLRLNLSPLDQPKGLQPTSKS